MDFGLYNKEPQQAGRHGTLVGLWYEEVALDAPLDRTRPRYANTFARVIAHLDNKDNVKKETIHQTSFQYDRQAAIEAQKLHKAMTLRHEMLATIKAASEQKQRKAYETSYQCTIGMPKQLTKVPQPSGSGDGAAAGASGASAAGKPQDLQDDEDVEVPF